MSEEYPTKKELKQLKSMGDDLSIPGFKVLDSLENLWNKNYGSVTNTLSPSELEVVRPYPNHIVYRFATGGWSGNEDLINTFMKTFKGKFYWLGSFRGGLWFFECLPPK